MEGYFKKVLNRGNKIKEFYLLSDDRQKIVHAKNVSESVDYNINKHGWVNMGWELYGGDYNPENDDIKPNTKFRITLKGNVTSSRDLMRVLLTYRCFIQGIAEYTAQYKGYEYDQSISNFQRAAKGTNLKGVKNALYIANPSDIKNFGFYRIKNLIKNKLKNPKYYILYISEKYTRDSYYTPLCLACTFEEDNGRKLIIDRLPEFHPSYLFEPFFMTVISTEFREYEGVRIFYEPTDETEIKTCIKYKFTRTDNIYEFSATEDEVFYVKPDLITHIDET